MYPQSSDVVRKKSELGKQRTGEAKSGEQEIAE